MSGGKVEPGIRVERVRDRALTGPELAAAARACFDNAADLIGDAELLEAAGRPARAGALACVALEELGKARLCLKLHEGRDRRHRDPGARAEGGLRAPCAARAAAGRERTYRHDPVEHGAVGRGGTEGPG